LFEKCSCRWFAEGSEIETPLVTKHMGKSDLQSTILSALSRICHDFLD
jgi:hypothetical protein